MAESAYPNVALFSNGGAYRGIGAVQNAASL
jgi:hypothetical protein